MQLQHMAVCSPWNRKNLFMVPSTSPAGSGDPEALTVIGQNPDRLPTAAAENKQAARRRIGRQFLPAQLRQRIYALPFLRCTAKQKICAVHCYAELRGADPQNRPRARSWAAA